MSDTITDNEEYNIGSCVVKQTQDISETANEVLEAFTSKADKQPTNEIVIDWRTKPIIKNQIATHPHTVKLSSFKAECFDLSDTNSLASYNEVINKSLGDDRTVVILNHIVKFSEKNSNFIAYVAYNIYKFSHRI